jgi:hypothetical protein
MTRTPAALISAKVIFCGRSIVVMLALSRHDEYRSAPHKANYAGPAVEAAYLEA